MLTYAIICYYGNAGTDLLCLQLLERERRASASVKEHDAKDVMTWQCSVKARSSPARLLAVCGSADVGMRRLPAGAAPEILYCSRQ